jgi:hypothetical protein
MNINEYSMNVFDENSDSNVLWEEFRDELLEKLNSV